MAFLFAREQDPQQDAFLRSREGHMGHPTASGPRDEKRRRMGFASPGNGVPNIPRYLSLGTHHPGILYGSKGPKAPGVEYDNPDDRI